MAIRLGNRRKTYENWLSYTTVDIQPNEIIIVDYNGTAYTMINNSNKAVSFAQLIEQDSNIYTLDKQKALTFVGDIIGIDENGKTHRLSEKVSKADIPSLTGGVVGPGNSGANSVQQDISTDIIIGYSNDYIENLINNGDSRIKVDTETKDILTGAFKDKAVSLGMSQANGLGAFAEGYRTIAANTGAHAEGVSTASLGNGAHAEGSGTVSEGTGAHAEGLSSQALKPMSHAEGRSTIAKAQQGHAEGTATFVNAHSSHAEGRECIVIKDNLTDETLIPISYNNGILTLQSTTNNFFNNEIPFLYIENVNNGVTFGNLYEVLEKNILDSLNASFKIDIYNSTGQGEAPLTNMVDTSVTAIVLISSDSDEKGKYGHAEGYGTIVNGQAGHAEGYLTKVLGLYGHTEGARTVVKNSYAHAEGYQSIAKGLASHAEGASETGENANYGHSEGYQSKAIGRGAHAEGYQSEAAGAYTHAEGNSKAKAEYAHSEGRETVAEGTYTHAEGYKTQAIGTRSHAEGTETIARGAYAHAEGSKTEAKGAYSHARGRSSKANGEGAVAEGWGTNANGAYSHAEGIATTATRNAQHVFGVANDTKNTEDCLIVVGNGKDNGAGYAQTRSNAYKLKEDGTAWHAGDVQSTDKDGNINSLNEIKSELNKAKGDIEILKQSGNTEELENKVNELDSEVTELQDNLTNNTNLLNQEVINIKTDLQETGTSISNLNQRITDEASTTKAYIDEKSEALSEELREVKNEFITTDNKFNNIFDTEDAYIDYETDTIKSDDRYRCTSEYIPICNTGDVYYAYVVLTKAPTDNYVHIIFYDENKQYANRILVRTTTNVNTIYNIRNENSGTGRIKYFRLYADKGYDGQIYISDVEPRSIDLVNYEYKSVTEVEDIRTGYDGTEYGTAGEAVRQQITDLYKNKQDVNMNVVSDNKFNGVFDLYGYYVKDDGTVATSSNYKCTSLIPLYETPVKYAYIMATKPPAMRIFCTFYNENEVKVAQLQLLPSTSLETIKYTYNSTENIKYFRIYTEKKYDGQIYISPYNPSNAEALDYSYKVEADQIDKLKDKVIVNFGDSIFGNYLYPNDISSELAKLTDATVHNCAFGGCRMGKHSDDKYDAFSMYRLADAIVTKDWTLQDGAGASASISNKQLHLDTLKSLDFNDVDIVTIAYGTNDCYSGSLDTDNADDLFDTTTFGGALRYSIETLLNAYPHLKIFICSQTYRFWVDDNNVFTEDSDTKTTSKGDTLIDFVEKTKEIAKEYKLPYIDNYYSLGINKFNRMNYFGYTSSDAIDGTHPILSGRRLIAAHIANELF